MNFGTANEKAKLFGWATLLIFLVVINAVGIYSTFFQSNERDPADRPHKGPINPSKETIVQLLGSIETSNVTLFPDPLEANKRIVVSEKDTIGYVYIVHEPISCASCSDVDYLLLLNTHYQLSEIVSLHDIIEFRKKLEFEEYNQSFNSFLHKNLIKDPIPITSDLPQGRQFAKYFKISMLNLQKQVKLSNEKYQP